MKIPAYIGSPEGVACPRCMRKESVKVIKGFVDGRLETIYECRGCNQTKFDESLEKIRLGRSGFSFSFIIKEGKPIEVFISTKSFARACSPDKIMDWNTEKEEK